jgi:hypothetical protein
MGSWRAPEMQQWKAEMVVLVTAHVSHSNSRPRLVERRCAVTRGQFAQRWE